jgi:leader peptidase (prepilin peptidase)/N-methyltransferase
VSFLSLFLLLIGPFIGSFVSATANAWPNWSQTLRVRSKCDHCQRDLDLIDLIPIASFLLLRGRCRTCQNPIGNSHFIAEILAALIAIASVLIFSGTLQVISAMFGWALLFASLVDIRLKLLPDSITLGLVPAGLLVLFWQGGMEMAKLSAIGAGLGYGVFFAIAWVYRRLRGRDGLGLGDAKLLASGGAWCGPFALSWIVLLAAASTLLMLGIHAKISKTPLRSDTAMAFGPALALGIYGLWLWSGRNGLGLALS